MRQRATARDSGGFAILDRQLAVDDDEAHAGREQCRMGEIGAWREGRRVEGDDVGEGTGLQRSAPVESEQLRGHRRAAVDEILQVYDLLVLDIGRIFAREGRIIPWVSTRRVRTDRKSTRLNSRHQCAYSMP